MINNGQIIANNICAERNRKKLTQEKISIELGIDKKTYAKYEKDASKIGATMLGSLACLFECNVNAFYLGTDFTKCETIDNCLNQKERG